MGSSSLPRYLGCFPTSLRGDAGTEEPPGCFCWPQSSLTPCTVASCSPLWSQVEVAGRAVAVDLSPYDRGIIREGEQDNEVCRTRGGAQGKQDKGRCWILLSIQGKWGGAAESWEGDVILTCFEHLKEVPGCCSHGMVCLPWCEVGRPEVEVCSCPCRGGHYSHTPLLKSWIHL